MFAESLVGWPVLFLVIATAVEDHEAAFTGVEGSLGFADCALVFVRERGGGCHLDWGVWWLKENDKSLGQVSWVNKMLVLLWRCWH
jgi:hypothetical protein